MYLRPVLLMETFLYWRLFHYYFNLISEACCHAKFMSDTRAMIVWSDPDPDPNLRSVGSRVDKQECATPDLSCTICRYPAPTAEFFVYVTFFQRNAALPQSSVRARAGHRPCSVKPSQVHEGKLSKRLAARASSKRLRQQKIPPWANPSGVAHSCLSTLGRILQNQPNTFLRTLAVAMFTK